jgi:hypothetical protein
VTLTQRQVATSLERPPPTVSWIETSIPSPQLAETRALCFAYGAVAARSRNAARRAVVRLRIAAEKLVTVTTRT